MWLTATLGLIVVLAGFATPASPAPLGDHFSRADIEPIIVAIAYRDVLGKKCGLPSAPVQAAFVTDLKSAGAARQLIAQSTSAAARIEERKTLKEDVCTAELFDSTEANAEAGPKAWHALKDRRS